MKEMTIKLYSIDELSGQAKEKAFESMKDLIIESNFNDFQFFADDELKFTYGLDAKLNYSLGYSQGDGLRFTTSNFATSAIINGLPFEKAFLDMLKALVLNGDLSVSINNNGEFWHYSYHHVRQVDVVFSEDVEESLPEATREAIKNAFIDSYMKVCDNLEKVGYQCYKVSDEDIIDTANANDYTYFANGELFHE